MRKRRRVSKRRKAPTKEELRRKKYKQVKKLSRKANDRLRSLDRRLKAGTWASRKLKNRLSIKKLKAWSVIDRVSVKKNLSLTDLKMIEKAINQFLESKTSTKRGIEEAKNRVKDSIKTTLNEEGYDLSDEDADIFYSMLEDDDFNFFADKVGASTMWAIMDDAIEYNESDTKFANRIERYITTINDLDTLERVQNLYNKYVRK